MVKKESHDGKKEAIKAQKNVINCLNPTFRQTSDSTTLSILHKTSLPTLSLINNSEANDYAICQ